MRSQLTGHKKPRLYIALLAALTISTGLMNSSDKELSESEREPQQLRPHSIKTQKSLKEQNDQKDQEVSVIMSDPAISQAWGLHKIDIKRALRISQGEGIVVAVIDTGIDLAHPDLQNRVWVNPGETGKDKNGNDLASNGIDDDKNGCIDDVYGCNFITGVGTFDALKDNHGHGTHISGIIAAEGGNGIGITGVAPKAQIMTLKYYDPTAKNSNNLTNTIKALRYAVAMKKMYPKQIKKMIINYSGGGTTKDPAEEQAVKMAHEAGILLVAAAGNEGSNTDMKRTGSATGYFPAGYDLDNIISVTATGEANTRSKGESKLKSSNFGIDTVDIAAPGGDIYSTYPGGRYGQMTGTSQATAFASGVAALIMARYPDFSAQQVKKYLLKTGDVLTSLKGLTHTSRRLNSYKALVTLDSDVSAMGVMATNTMFMDPFQFSGDPGQAFESGNNLDVISDVASQLVEAAEKDIDKKRLRLPNNTN